MRLEVLGQGLHRADGVVGEDQLDGHLCSRVGDLGRRVRRARSGMPSGRRFAATPYQSAAERVTVTAVGVGDEERPREWIARLSGRPMRRPWCDGAGAGQPWVETCGALVA